MLEQPASPWNPSGSAAGERLGPVSHPPAAALASGLWGLCPLLSGMSSWSCWDPPSGLRVRPPGGVGRFRPCGSPGLPAGAWPCVFEAMAHFVRAAGFVGTKPFLVPSPPAEAAGSARPPGARAAMGSPQSGGWSGSRCGELGVFVRAAWIVISGLPGSLQLLRVKALCSVGLRLYKTALLRSELHDMKAHG